MKPPRRPIHQIVDARVYLVDAATENDVINATDERQTGYVERDNRQSKLGGKGQ